MYLPDLFIFLSLAGFILFWWRQKENGRAPLIGFLGLLFVSSILAIAQYRWQAGLALISGVIFLITLVLKKPPVTHPYISSVLFTLLAFLSAGLIHFFPIHQLPEPTGEFKVGTRDFDLIDQSRKGIMLADSSEGRKLLVRVWYPTDAQADDFEVENYFREDELGTTAKGVGSMVGAPFLFQHLKLVKTNSLKAAPPLTTKGKLPTIFYSHGYTSFAGQNTVLMEELASHGYIVYAVNHTYDSAPVTFTDGEKAYSDPSLKLPPPNSTEALLFENSRLNKEARIGKTFDARLNAMIGVQQVTKKMNSRVATLSPNIWLDDRLFVHDQLETGNVPESITDLLAISNFSETGQMGMSFGGSTSGALCLIDTRCKAGVNMDGGDRHVYATNTDMPVPFMVLHSDYRDIVKQAAKQNGDAPYSFNEFSYSSFAKAGLNPDIHRVIIKDAKHLGLSDFPLFLRTPLRNTMLGSVDTDTIILGQNRFVKAFFDKYLRGLASGFPNQQYLEFPGAITPYDNSRLSTWWNALPKDKQQAYEAKIDEMKKQFGPYFTRSPELLKTPTQIAKAE